VTSQTDNRTLYSDDAVNDTVLCVTKVLVKLLFPPLSVVL